MATEKGTDTYDVMNLKALRCFWAVGRLGSLTRAGLELGISEAAVSQRIKSLERYLDAKLYESRGGKIRLTAAGESTLSMAIRLFDELTTFCCDLGAEESAGTVSIAANDLVLKYILPGLFREFPARFPRVFLRLLGRKTKEAHEMVRMNEVDFGIVPERRLPRGLTSIPWQSCAATLILAREHPLLRSGLPRLEELLHDRVLCQYPLIEPETDEPGNGRIEQALRRLGLTYNARVEIGTFDTVKNYVRTGWGLAVVPGICITEKDRADLTCIDIPKRYEGETNYRVVLREDKHLGAPLRFLLSTLSLSIGDSKGGWPGIA